MSKRSSSPSGFTPVRCPSTAPAEQKLQSIRSVLRHKNLDAYIIPTADAHISEYVSDRDKRRSYVSNFTGSAGTALVTNNEALLYTDGRYFLQADKELTKEWTLMKQGVEGVPSLEEWLVTNLPPSSKVGFDPLLVPVSQYTQIETKLQSNKIDFVPVDGDNLVDLIWEDQPAMPKGTINVHPIEYAGETTASKLARILTSMAKEKVYATVLCALDEIAWVFNLRGTDISFNPVFLSYAVITQDGTHLFVDKSKFHADVKLDENLTIHDYNDVFDFLGTLKLTMETKKSQDLPYKAWVDKGKSNIALLRALGYGITNDSELIRKEWIVDTANPVGLMKAIKNDAELEGMKNAHIRDGAAMVRFLSWFETQYGILPSFNDDSKEIESSPWNEHTIAEKLEDFRRQQDKFVGLSFDTISSIGPNGAIIHYKPDEHTSSPVTTGQVYLLDSGGQYLDGTTDITRTFYIPDAKNAPEPTDFQKETYTRVLQGHIAIATARFPVNTPGPAIDAFARKALWDVGLNYLHGTGHGVGSYLNVHEGPCGISMLTRIGPAITTPLVPGMVLSNEPGYYHDGEFGIRIENLVHVVPKETKYNNGKYFGFNDLTMVPIDRKLMNLSLLTPQEKDWVNTYHQEVRTKVAPLLSTDEVALKWLERETQPL